MTSKYLAFKTFEL